MKALIIDNEQAIREGLKEMISTSCQQITSVQEANGVAEGIEAIYKVNPDIVFLDVEMGDGTGFDLMRKLQHVNFGLVFITAHDKYAVDAFRFSAIDFLLKPIDRVDLITAVDRVIQQRKTADLQRQMMVLQESLGTLKNSDKKIVLKDSESFHFVNVNDIIRCEADGAYTKFFISGTKNILISKVLKEYEELLAGYNFVRVHHSHLVNTHQIVRFDRADGGNLMMANGDVVPVSQRKREQLLGILSSLM